MPSTRFRTLKELDSTEGTVRLMKAVQLSQYGRKSELLLVPQPSENPNDPLLWPAWKKHMAFAAVCFFSFNNNFTLDAPTAGYVNIAASFGTTVSRTSGLLTWAVLTLGLSNFFWVPTSSYLGKRPAFLIAVSIEAAATAWSAKATSFNSLLASSVVAAFGGGASEAMAVAVINELYFLHERGTYMGYYIICLAWGSSIGPLCGGYIIEHLGLPWQKWISLILLATNLVWFALFFPETRFHRAGPVAMIETAHAIPVSTEVENSKDGDENSRSDRESGEQKLSLKTWAQGLNVWSGIDRETTYFSLMFRPIPLLIYPATLYALLSYSVSLAPTIMIAILSSPILAAPPYKFGAGVIGLINAPAAIGNLIGAIVGGWVTDKWIGYRARKNNGVFEPETRLVLILPLAIGVTIGMLMFGFAAKEQLSWPVIYVSYGFCSVGLTGIASISMTYAVESYYPVSAECLEIINGLKNVVSFAIIFATVPWGEVQGYDKEFGEMTAIFVAIIALSIPLALYGRTIRHYTSLKWRLISWS